MSPNSRFEKEKRFGMFLTHHQFFLGDYLNSKVSTIKGIPSSNCLETQLESF